MQLGLLSRALSVVLETHSRHSCTLFHCQGNLQALSVWTGEVLLLVHPSEFISEPGSCLDSLDSKRPRHVIVRDLELVARLRRSSDPPLCDHVPAAGVCS